jgi:pimeloyl-ACP methyl ester carboxylesterase
MTPTGAPRPAQDAVGEPAHTARSARHRPGALCRPVPRRHGRHVARAARTTAVEYLDPVLHLGGARPSKQLVRPRTPGENTGHTIGFEHSRAAMVHTAVACRQPGRTRYYERMVSGTPAEGYASCCTAIQTMDIAAGLSRITAPTLVIAGAQDPATPPQHGQRTASTVPLARFETISPTAHLASAELPDTVNDLILSHLKHNS